MMIMALIVPELIATWAIRQWLSARALTKRFKGSGYFGSGRPLECSDSGLCSLRHSKAPAEQSELQVEGEFDIMSCILNVFLKGRSLFVCFQLRL